MNKEALFCDGTGSYVIPWQPKANEAVTLRFRTGRDDVESVELLTEEQMDSRMLRKAGSTKDFDYYEIEVRLSDTPFRYSFVVQSGQEICWYDRTGVSDKRTPYYDFVLVPGFSTPDWAKGAVMYQIFVDRFYNGDPTNDVQDNEYVYIGQPVRRAADWNSMPETMDIGRFYGGDLAGVLKKLDYLEWLGVEVIYFNPLFVSPSNHKYDTQDYDHIDPHYGVITEGKAGDGQADGRLAAVSDQTDRLPAAAPDQTDPNRLYRQRVCSMTNLQESDRLFIRLVEELHRRGMRVILDGVFNHCGSFNKWLDREKIYEGQPGFAPGAYIRSDSPYRSFFYFHDERKEAWPDNGSYDGWWGHDTLPKLAYESSPALVEYVMDIAARWVSPPYNADGWRLDVAADLGCSIEYNHMFWKKFRQVVKKANPEALIIAEHYGDPSEWLQGDEWDSVMNYDAFMEPVTWFLTGMEKHSDSRRDDLAGNIDYFAGAMRHHMAAMLSPSLYVAMNQLSNHDHSRFLTRTNRKVGRLDSLGSEAAKEGVRPSVFRLANVMLFTWVGAAAIYYGDEAGLCGFTDPDSRRPYPWGAEDRSLLLFHRQLAHMRRREQTLRTGSIKMLYGAPSVLAYGRFDDRESIVVVLNNGDARCEVTVPVRYAQVGDGRMRRLLYTYETGYTTETDTYIVENGEVALNMGAHSAIILKAGSDEEKEAGAYEGCDRK